MKRAIRLYVSGKIQRVFYKSFIKEKAEKLMVNGFTRNLDDGRIEIFLEGDSKNVRELEDFAKKGPRNSEIKNVEIKEERFQDIKSFKILHI